MNIIKCDCCGKEIYNGNSSNKFILPIIKVDEEICTYQGKELSRTKLGEHIEKQEKDVCFKCQNKIVKFCNLLSFVDVSMYDIELEVFNKFKESITNKEWKVKE